MPELPSENAPAILASFNPAVTLTAEFTAQGNVTISCSVKQGDSYSKRYTVDALAPAIGAVAFEFGVDGEPGDPRSALLVQRAFAWDLQWEEESASVLGGKPFPFGAAPCLLADTYDPRIPTRRTLQGVFSGPYEFGYQLTITSPNRTSISTIPKEVPSKFLSLWLPAGTTGYVKIQGLAPITSESAAAKAPPAV